MEAWSLEISTSHYNEGEPVLRIQVLSDLHHEERDALEVPPTKADIVVLAGDIAEGTAGVAWAMKTFKVPVLYILGNHEPYGCVTMRQLEEDIRVMTQGSHVRLLQNEVTVIDGVRFMGGTLWSDYCVTGNQAEVMELAAGKSDFKRIRIDDAQQAFDPAALIELHATALAFLRAELAKPFDGKTVVVSHFGSSPQALLSQHSTYPTRGTYTSDLEHLMGPGIDLWIHGHIHDSLDFKVNGTRVLCNPRGGIGPKSVNLNFDPALVVEV